MTTVSEACELLAKNMSLSFSLKRQGIDASQVFSDDGLLPAMAKRADHLSTLCLGYGVGAKYEDCERSMLGVKVVFDDLTPMAVRLVCLLDVLVNLRDTSTMEDGKVALDELLLD